MDAAFAPKPHEGAIGMVDGKSQGRIIIDGLGDCLPACPIA